jgi:hypothetical protein
MPKSPISVAGGAMPADGRHNRRLFLAAGSAAAVFAGLKGAARAAPVAMVDGYLLSLGKELDAASENETAVLAAADGLPGKEIDRLYDPARIRSKDLVEKIIATKATTIDGLKVKARALAWCHSGDVIDATSFDSYPTTDIKVLASIAQDLLYGGA